MSTNVTKVDAVVIGAGVMGLAVARALSSSCPPMSDLVVPGSQRTRKRQRRQHDVLLLEKNSAIGMETSSRNSQVIHAGLYYPTDSNKARWCVNGRHLLYKYCDERSVFVNQCGKLVVATTPQQVHGLQALHQQAIRNGVHDVEMITSSERVVDMEPELTTTTAALWSPSTGILDAHGFMQHLLTDAVDQGSTTLALNTCIKEARISNEGRVQLRVPTSENDNNDDEDDDDMWLDCNVVVNAAGLWADEVARTIHRGSREAGALATSTTVGAWQPPRQYFCRGTYFCLEGVRHAPFTRLVYPIPDPSGGLGIHATLDEAGQIKFGPDVEWLPIELDDVDDNSTSAATRISPADTLTYVPDPNRAQSFYDSIRTYWPNLPRNSLVPDYCGIRPKLSHPSLHSRTSNFQDFCVAGPKEHGVKGLVHLLGMESPGLTSALAVAEHVADLLEDA